MLEAPEHVYVVPQRLIKSPDDMVTWEKSSAYHAVVGFINTVSQAIQGHRITERLPVSDQVRDLLNVLARLNAFVDAAPPIDQPQRFGNKAFRDYYNLVRRHTVELLQAALPEHLQRAAVEISFYLVESFGNATRIDYGTGHELAFVMFLCCLFKVKALVESDLLATGLQLFTAYLNLVRRLQITYQMEPAGSHGVWSLDDFQFIPFIWGSAQLAVQAPLRPAQFLDAAAIAEFKDAYMFVGSIDYINNVKRGNFAEHSPQLWNISAVESWVKINCGLVKMYQKELLAKYPVIQHVLIGSLMELKAMPIGTVVPGPRLGMLPPRVPPPSAAPSTQECAVPKAPSTLAPKAAGDEGEDENRSGC